MEICSDICSNSFTRATSLRKNREHQGTDNVQGQICFSHLMELNGGCWFILQIFFFRYQIFPSFSKGIFSHMTHLNQLCAKENISWIIRSTQLQFTTITCFQNLIHHYFFLVLYTVTTIARKELKYMYNFLIEQ